jgi:transposase
MRRSLLCLELEDAGFDYSVLCEFRARLLGDGAEHRLFDRILTLLQERKLVKARGRQRTDSTHVVAAVRDLNRLERVMETLRAALNVLCQWHNKIPQKRRLRNPQVA